MSDFLEYICSWSALKWIAIVLIASFIGQFGKMLAQAVVRKINLSRQKKQRGEINEPPLMSPDQIEPAANNPKNVVEVQKTYPDKKALKIAAKESKKFSKKIQ